jgi:hypothetical protein
MRILLTGGTKRQTGTEDPLYELINIPSHMARSLRNMGHTVDWKVWDGFGHYDLRIVAVAPIAERHTTYALQSYRAMATDEPTVLYFDDYQLNLVRDQAQAVVNGTWAPDPPPLDLDTLVGVCQALATGNWPPNWHPLIPAYNWGDKAIVANLLGIPPYRLASIDPSITALEPAHLALSRIAVARRTPQRREAWFLPALNSHTQWVASLGLTRPVVTVGQYKRGIRLKSETDVAQAFHGFAGALSPPYPQEGSGWFRSRYIYALMAGTPLVGSPGDGLGPAYRATAQELEAMTQDQWGDLVQAQATDLKPRLGSAVTFNENLRRLVQYVAT